MVKKRKILLRIAGCIFCKNAEEALDAAKVQYEKLEVDPFDRTLVEKLSGQSTVPVLVEVIGSESQDDEIVQYAQELLSKQS